MKTSKQYIKEAKASISKNFWYSSSNAEELKNILIELILNWEKETIPNADDEDVGYLKGLKKCADELARVTNLRR
jgi:hypothetical protein